MINFGYLANTHFDITLQVIFKNSLVGKFTIVKEDICIYKTWKT